MRETMFGAMWETQTDDVSTIDTSATKSKEPNTLSLKL